RRCDTGRLRLKEVQNKRSTNALTVEMAALDAQMIEQRDVVGSVGVPVVSRGDRGVRLAAGIALVHRDDAVLAREFGGGVDWRRGLAPNVDHRREARRREGQDREAGAEFFVMD